MKPNNLPVHITENELRKIINTKITEVLNEKTIHRISINQLINEDYQRVLQEEYGIRFNTISASDEIITKIQNVFKNNSFVSKDNNGLKNYTGKITCEFNGVDININYTIINFVSLDIFEKLSEAYDLSASYNRENNIMYINLAMINGQFVIETSYNSLQHELSHVFDCHKYEGNFIPEKEIKIYKMAISQSENPINELSFNLSLAVYISFKAEQIAMCNGLDAMMRHDNHFDIYQSNECGFLYYLKEVITHIDTYADLIIRLYKMTPEKMLKRLKSTYNDYLRRIGRVIAYHKTSEL